MGHVQQPHLEAALHVHVVLLLEITAACWKPPSKTTHNALAPSGLLSYTAVMGDREPPGLCMSYNQFKKLHAIIRHSNTCIRFNGISG